MQPASAQATGFLGSAPGCLWWGMALFCMKGTGAFLWLFIILWQVQEDLEATSSAASSRGAPSEQPWHCPLSRMAINLWSGRGGTLRHPMCTCPALPRLAGHPSCELSLSQRNVTASPSQNLC